MLLAQFLPDQLLKVSALPRRLFPMNASRAAARIDSMAEAGR
jgi:hypothetical protein